MQPSFNFLDKTISLFNLDTMALTIHYACQTHLFAREYEFLLQTRNSWTHSCGSTTCCSYM